ncbi:MAG: glutamate-5-semialdehyde dehydrogenase [Clostridia bacterium]|nr:glutamate-5-semialdehyde dehydrogenase [Clostridia bacterium]MDD4572371.1 glutamate-5-semialdehyde dehydrogenase [Clostridia bacterium]
MLSLEEIGAKAKAASFVLAQADSETKNKALAAMAQELLHHKESILAANEQDMAAAREKGMPKAFLDRLLLTEARIEDMAEGLKALMALPDPIGEVDKMWRAAQDIQVGKVRVPLGVIGIIYEARPNVTADAAGICLKTGNSVILRGGSDALVSNKAVAGVLSRAAASVGLPEGSVQIIEDTSRETATQMMRLNQYIDVLIPRGGAGLIKSVVENASVPVIETGVGNCHIYVEKSADFAMAVNIILNAKTQRPAVCNAAEGILVDEAIAEGFLPLLGQKLAEAGVEIRGCAKTVALIKEAKAATDEDYFTEYGALIISVKVVTGIEEAIAHINHYGSKHSEAIITNDYANAGKFQREVDAAAVYVNASTRFTDGFQFGFGAEIGISTQKLHARGPMGLEAMTSIKYIVNGNGQVRN